MAGRDRGAPAARKSRAGDGPEPGRAGDRRGTLPRVRARAIPPSGPERLEEKSPAAPSVACLTFLRGPRRSLPSSGDTDSRRFESCRALHGSTPGDDCFPLRDRDGFVRPALAGRAPPPFSNFPSRGRSPENGFRGFERLRATRANAGPSDSRRANSRPREDLEFSAAASRPRPCVRQAITCVASETLPAAERASPSLGAARFAGARASW